MVVFEVVGGERKIGLCYGVNVCLPPYIAVLKWEAMEIVAFAIFSFFFLIFNFSN
jgi:hypothetical protein